MIMNMTWKISAILLSMLNGSLFSTMEDLKYWCCFSVQELCIFMILQNNSAWRGLISIPSLHFKYMYSNNINCCHSFILWRFHKHQTSFLQLYFLHNWDNQTEETMVIQCHHAVLWGFSPNHSQYKSHRLPWGWNVGHLLWIKDWLM